jgi:hypothetical protein
MLYDVVHDHVPRMLQDAAAQVSVFDDRWECRRAAIEVHPIEPGAAGVSLRHARGSADTQQSQTERREELAGQRRQV